MNSQHKYDADVVIVGGGLAGGLAALALTEHTPSLRVLLVEGNAMLSGNHTWCCHRSDIELLTGETAPLWFTRILSHRWSAYTVRFPRYDRQIEGDYFCLTSDRLRAALVATHAQGALDLMLGDPAELLSPHQVTLASGRTVSGAAVIDARGGATSSRPSGSGFQKFVGWEVEVLDGSHPFGDCPVLMDATVEQADGYRFVYTLPFSSRRVLVEDTYFSRTSSLNEEHLRTRLSHYLSSHGVRDYRIVREERGILPMPWRDQTASATRKGITIGYRGGFFQPATGYSLGQAVVVAEQLARSASVAAKGVLGTSLRQTVDSLIKKLAGDAAFARKLNFLAFAAARARGLRELVFARVYQMPEPFLRRFYAARLTRRDRFALLAGTARLPLFVSTEPKALRAGERA